MSMNIVIIQGRLTKDPELRRTNSGKAVTSFTLAVEDDYQADKSGNNKDVDFIDCVAWQGTAEFVNNYFKKGRMALVHGKLKIRTYEKDGQKRKATEVVVDNIYFSDSKPSSTGGSANDQQYGGQNNGQQYGAPQNGGQYGAPQNGGQYGAPQNGASQNGGQYGAPQNSGQYGGQNNGQQYGAPQNGGQYGAPQNGGQYGAPQNGGQYGAPQNGGQYGGQGGGFVPNNNGGRGNLPF